MARSSVVMLFILAFFFESSYCNDGNNPSSNPTGPSSGPPSSPANSTPSSDNPSGPPSSTPSGPSSSPPSSNNPSSTPSGPPSSPASSTPSSDNPSGPSSSPPSSNNPSSTPSGSSSGPSSSTPSSGNPSGGSGGSKPEVVISFESLHDPSIQFFKTQLKPIFDEFTACVKWHFIPCSTSKIVKDVLECKEGVMECQIDVLHACAAHFYEDDEVKLGKFFLCMMCDDEQYIKGEGCAKEAGMDWKLLNGCQPSKQAGQWCDNRYQQLNQLHELKIPGLLYNMKYDQSAEQESLKCLKTGICNQIKKQGGSCPACGGSSGGSGSSEGSGSSGGSGGAQQPGSGGSSTGH